MQEVSVASLTGEALDWAVANIEELPVRLDPMGFVNGSEAGFWIWDEKGPTRPRYQLIGRGYSPSTSWTQAGPIMEKFEVFPSRYFGCAETNPGKFQAGSGVFWMRGETPLVAAMRSIVAIRFGVEIEVPECLA